MDHAHSWTTRRIRAKSTLAGPLTALFGASLPYADFSPLWLAAARVRGTCVPGRRERPFRRRTSTPGTPDMSASLIRRSDRRMGAVMTRV